MLRVHLMSKYIFLLFLVATSVIFCTQASGNVRSNPNIYQQTDFKIPST